MNTRPSDDVTTRYRIFAVKYHGPAAVKGSRVTIHDLRHNKRRVLTYDDRFSSSLDIATDHLLRNGITVDALGLANKDCDCVLLSRDMATPLK